MSEDRPPQMPGASDLIGVGGYLVACVLAGMGLGWLADQWANSMPAFTLVGLALGVIAGAVGAWLRFRRFLS